MSILWVVFWVVVLYGVFHLVLEGPHAIRD
jgi:hypothetical protein